MSITQRLVDLMSGSITIESKPGKGSVFTVRLPQKRTGSAVCGSELAEKLKKFKFHSSAINKKTQFFREYMPYGNILLVDDVESNIHVAKGMLAPYGLKIDTASSGIKAVEKIKNGSIYDIIFMDHMMPIMDGIEAVKIIRESGYKHSIIALTANALIGREEMFLQNGFNGFISKPIDSRELNFLLNDLIRNKKPQEVVEAARQEQNKIKFNRNISANTISPDVEKSFARDAENAVNVLENLYKKIDVLTDEDLYMYIITVHGMKSALANVGERKMSGTAYKLELAGKDRKFNVIADETLMFINSLKSLIIKYKPADEENVDEISGEDLVYLNSNLKNIKTACETFNKKAAKTALNELKNKKWPHHVNSILNHISAHLLHSEFETAASLALDAADFNG